MSPTRSPARQALLLALAILVVFGLAFWAPFIYDDAAYMLRNPEVAGRWEGAAHWLATPLLDTAEYEPVVILVHRFLHLLGGERPFWYRLSSLALHWGNAVLLLLLYRRLLGKASACFWAALLFALFPAQTEVLAISTFKKHLLVSFFGLLMLHLQERHSWREPLRLAACWGAMTLALLTKESALILPPLCAAVSLATAEDRRRLLRRDRVLYAGWAVLCLALAAFRTFVLPRALTPLAGGAWTSHLLTAGKCLLWYLRELVVPASLSQEHSLAPAGALLTVQGLGILAGLLAVLALGLFLWKRDRVLGLSLLWCGLSLAPFLNLLPYLNFSLVANRYLYLASAGFFLGVGRLMTLVPERLRLTRRWALAPSLAAGLAILYASTAMAHLARYSDPVELWGHAVAFAPGNPRAHLILGQAYRERLRYDEAAAEFLKAVRLSPPHFAMEAYSNLATIYGYTGRLREAAVIMEGLARVRPSARVYNNLGAYLAMAGDKERSQKAFEAALRLDPRDGDTLLNLGMNDFQAGRLDPAERHWLAASSLPDQRAAALRYLGELYEKQGRAAKARAAYEASLAASPLQAETTARLAGLYAAAGQAARGRHLFDNLIAGISDRLQALRESRRSAQDAPLEEASELMLQAVRRDRARFLAGPGKPPP